MEDDLETSLHIQEIEKLNSIARQCDELKAHLKLIIIAQSTGLAIGDVYLKECITMVESIRSTAMMPKDFGDHEMDVPLL